MIRKLGLIAATCILVVLLPSFVNAAWKTVKLADGKSYGCQDTTTKLVVPLKNANGVPYTSSSSASTACTGGAASLWTFLGTANAAPLRYTLNCAANPDGSCSTQYPCVLTDRSDCAPPTTLTLTCSDSSAPSLSGLVASGTAYDEDVGQYFSGTGKSSATYSIVSVSGTDAATANWSLTGSIATTLNLHNTLANPGSLGSGSLKVRGTLSGNPIDCSVRNWSIVAPPSTDTTPPNFVTGINVPSVGSGTVTVAFDATTDPNDAVNRKGVATYRIKIGGSTVDTLTAPTAGLVNDFTAASVGSVSGSPSATQGTGASGGQWTLVGGGYGLEGGQPSNFYGITTPFSGDGCVIARIDSISNTMLYNKGPPFIANAASTTSAGLWSVVGRTGSTYFIQYSIRPTDGGTLSTSSSVTLSGLPVYVKQCQVGSAASIYYSSDGGAWTAFVTNLALTLNTNKVGGVMAAATTTGADQGNPTVVFGSVRVQTETSQLTKVVSTVSGGICTVTAIDAEGTPNESAAVGSATCTPNSASTAKKWHPGNYVQQRGNSYYCGTSCNANRHSGYAAYLGETNVTGVLLWVFWQYLESEAGNDFTAGFSWLDNEINFIKTTYPGKKIGLAIYFAPYGAGVDSTSQFAAYPDYLVNAGCTFSQAPGKPASMGIHLDDPTCRGYMKRLVAAYGARYDSETALEFIRLDQETDSVITGAGRNTGWEDLALAAGAAFPTTNVVVPLNWIGVDTVANKQAMIDYFEANHVVIMTPDTIPVTGTNPGYSCDSSSPNYAPTWPTCILQGLTTTNHHNYCGEAAQFQAVEDSETGYNSVPPGDLTALQVVTSWNNDGCGSHGIWDYPGGPTATWSDELVQINAHPQLTHNSYPSSYP